VAETQELHSPETENRECSGEVFFFERRKIYSYNAGIAM